MQSVSFNPVSHRSEPRDVLVAALMEIDGSEL